MMIFCVFLQKRRATGTFSQVRVLSCLSEPWELLSLALVFLKHLFLARVYTTKLPLCSDPKPLRRAPAAGR